jgi:hypothetical protein
MSFISLLLPCASFVSGASVRVLDEAHNRQVEETTDVLSEGPEVFYG